MYYGLRLDQHDTMPDQIKEQYKMSTLYEPFQPLLTDSGLHNFSLVMRECSPSKYLSGIVHSYLQIDTRKPTPYPVIPDGCQALFVSQHSTNLSGGIRQAINLQLPAQGEYFGIRFYPSALRHFFKINLAEIGNQLVEGQFLPARFLARLHEHLYQYNSFQQRAVYCDQWLLQQLRTQPPSIIDQALALIYRSRGNIEVDRVLARDIGVSRRHLNRLFRQHTGLSTKSFAQTVRFQHISKQLSVQPKNSLKVALSFGYFDQAHLINDFKRRVGQSPLPFFSRFMSDFYNKKSL